MEEALELSNKENGLLIILDDKINMRQISQDELFRVVSTWHKKEKSQYRIFKCGNCRRPLRCAWHYRLHIGGFLTLVHLCRVCQRNLDITYPKLNIEHKKLNFKFSHKLLQIFKAIINTWNFKERARYKHFNCDYCKRRIFKANHIFIRLNRKISELHFCKFCFRRLSLGGF